MLLFSISEIFRAAPNQILVGHSSSSTPSPCIYYGRFSSVVVCACRADHGRQRHADQYLPLDGHWHACGAHPGRGSAGVCQAGHVSGLWSVGRAVGRSVSLHFRAQVCVYVFSRFQDVIAVTHNVESFFFLAWTCCNKTSIVSLLWFLIFLISFFNIFFFPPHS